MKLQKLFSLDSEVVEELQKLDNASKFVNDLVKETLFIGVGLKKDEIKEKIAKLDQKISEQEKDKLELQKKLTELLEREQEVQKAFENLPEEIIHDFEDFPKISEEMLRVRFETKDSQGRKVHKHYENVTWEEVLNAFHKWKKQN